MGRFLERILEKLMENALMWAIPIVVGVGIELLDYWGPWRTAGIASCAAFVVWGTLMFFRQERRLNLRRQEAEEHESIISGLDAAERNVIESFREMSARELAIDIPAIAGLCGKGILMPAIRNGQIKRGSDGEIHSVFCMMLSPLGRKILDREFPCEKQGR